MTTPLVSRAAAGLKPPKATPPAISSQGQTAHYGGPSPWGKSADRSSPEAFAASTDHARCASIWRAWQSFHMAPVSAGGRGWKDIAYNSGVCPHGYRFEGRGPGVRSGANGTTLGNASSTATCYIAGDADPLTDGAKLAFGDEFERMSPARWVHSDWKSTGCPGDPIREWQAQGWPPPDSSEDDMTPEEHDLLVQTHMLATAAANDAAAAKELAQKVFDRQVPEATVRGDIVLNRKIAAEVGVAAGDIPGEED